jgi:hypothetical protein
MTDINKGKGAMTASNYCSMPECDGELAPGTKLPFCKNCRASMGVWRKRGIRAILARRSRLKKYDSRMATLETNKGERK